MKLTASFFETKIVDVNNLDAKVTSITAVYLVLSTGISDPWTPYLGFFGGMQNPVLTF